MMRPTPPSRLVGTVVVAALIAVQVPGGVLRIEVRDAPRGSGTALLIEIPLPDTTGAESPES
jgi:hypothetical protein